MSYILYRPESMEEAVSLQRQTGGSYLAGGTVSLVNLHRGKPIGDVQISLDRIDGLHRIFLNEQTLSVGSMVTMDELENSRYVSEHAAALRQSACEVGGPQIRNRATLGGNLASASPASDCATPLLAMDAVLHVYGEKGERKLPLRDFFLGGMRKALEPDEIILSVEIPFCPDSVSVFRKIGKRNALAVSVLNMAVVRGGGKISVAVGAAASRPICCPKTSEILSGSTAAMEEAEAMLQTEICPRDGRWATASYRRMVCVNLLRELMKETEQRQ